VINPSAIDILRTIDATITDKVEPSLSDLSGRSATATVRHLLRHVMVRIEVEGQLFTNDIVALREVLGKARDYFASLGSDHEGAAHAAKVALTLTELHRAPTQYPSLTILAAEAGALRQCLYQALKHLQAIRDDRKEDAAYASIRAAIRTYLVSQIEQEEQMIAPAFFGKGPRR
jgi:hypothetical protein